MIRGVLTLSTLASAIFFPWPYTVLLGFASALAVPLLPLAAGILVDLSYHAPAAGPPLGTIVGAAVSIIALLVRKRLKPGIIEG